MHATNAMMETYHCETIPQLMQELEEIYTDLCTIISDAMLQGAEVISSKVSKAKINAMTNKIHFMSINTTDYGLGFLFFELNIVLHNSCYLQANEQSKRYESLANQCRIVSGQQDLLSILKFLQPETPPKVPRKAYAPPHPVPGEGDETQDYSVSYFSFKYFESEKKLHQKKIFIFLFSSMFPQKNIFHNF